jgi:hypothetical protein
MTFSAGLVVGTSVNFGLLELLVSASADLKSTCTGKSLFIINYPQEKLFCGTNIHSHFHSTK